MPKPYPPSVRVIETSNLTWVDIANPSPKNMAYLKKKFRVHDLDIADCLSPAQVPKVDNFQHYLFIVLVFPVYDREKRAIYSSEVDFFINKKFFVTVHRNELPRLTGLFDNYKKSRRKLPPHAYSILYEVLEALLLGAFPMLEHINTDIKELEKRIFTGYERAVVQDLLIIKRNIISFRKAMQFHHGILERCIIKSEKFFSPKKLSREKMFYNNLVEHTNDIWDTLEIQKENIDALHLTNESLISFRLNDIMRLLTIISVILFTLTMVAATLGMGASGTPLLHSPGSFWVILGLMGAIALGILLFFKGKRWL